MIKDLLVTLSPNSKGEYPVLDYAVSLAASLQAFVTGVSFALEPVISPDIVGGMPVALIEAQRASSEKEAREAAARLRSTAEKAGLAVDTKVLDATFAGAAETFARMARAYDLAVLPQAEPESMLPDQSIVESTLFDSGRPAIVVPYIQREPFSLNRVMVCWDGSRAAARALGDAMPFLERAHAIEVLTVLAGDSPLPVDVKEVGAHLSRHGLDVKISKTVADTDVGNTLLSWAADISADFMVMGAYGHSRLREFILGGATRTVLGSMTIPLLMSH
jgi:nucleotide-binding universal stress UspA family protein